VNAAGSDYRRGAPPDILATVATRPADDDDIADRARQAAGTACGGRITANRVRIELGTGTARFEALHDVSIAVEPGEFVCLLGPSGCGKSTLLGALAGHLRITQGTLQLDGVSIEGPDSQRGLVFQHHTLFPWKTVLGNVAHGPKMKGIDRRTREHEARRMIELVGLAGFEARYPRELSGGMQQRIEIARVLINHPRVLLMDEPFGALDALTRTRMQELLLTLWARMRTTVLFVTHDIDEALFLADRVLILSRGPGRIVEELPVLCERPRHTGQLTDAQFVTLKRRCLALLRDSGGAVPDREHLTPLGSSLDEPS
jgi:NitT/TauT family transport system ATP-binding protein